MKIGLNLLHAQSGIGGAWNYIEYIVKAIARYDSSNEYIAYCNVESFKMIPACENITVKMVGINYKNRFQRIFYEQMILQFVAKYDGLDCLYWFANVGGVFNLVPGIVTIHDLKVFKSPHSFSVLYRIYLKNMIPYSVKKAAINLAISEKTASDLIDAFGVERERVVVVSSPIGYEYKKRSVADVYSFKEIYKLPDKFWLYVAHCYDHKNHESLFRAYASLKERKYDPWPLVLRGDKLSLADKIDKLINELGIISDIIWLPRLSIDEMPILYSSASALIYPSLYEGGGIPVMEAMACGLPIVASTIPTNKEFVGDAAIYFDPMNVSAIADAMYRFECDPLLRKRCAEKGLEKASELRPEIIMSKLQLAFRRVIDKKK